MTSHEDRGKLHKALGISVGVKIPFTWLAVIHKTEYGKWAYNPTKIGYKRVSVTPELKRMVVEAENWKRTTQRRMAAKQSGDENVKR